MELPDRGRPAAHESGGFDLAVGDTRRCNLDPVDADVLEKAAREGELLLRRVRHARRLLAVEPHPRVHVYAPGAASYRIVAVTIAPEPLVRVLPMKYPASEIYFFKPLEERVPVYVKPFTLLQEVVVEGTVQAQAALRGKPSLTLTGADTLTG